MKIRSRLLTKLLAIAAVVVARLLFATCRRRTRAAVRNINVYLGTGAARHLYCIWHDQILMTVFFGRPQHVAGLVSRHQDGSYLADAMRMVGIKPIRGSSSRGGAQALRQLRDAARNHHIAITPDGPRGPRRQVKHGIVYLASQTGRAIVPTAYACRRGWRLRGSWTDLLIPRPFTTIYAIGGRPLHVPANLSREELDPQIERLQAEMDRLQDEVERWASGQRPGKRTGADSRTERAAA